jgi:hypothetical protein
MDYSTWVDKDGELSEDAFDWTSDVFTPDYKGDATPEAIAEALPDAMSPELKAAIADVVLGLAYGMTLLLQSAPSP